MSAPAPYPIRVLELRSVRGTGGGPEKTILLGAARSDRSRYAVTVCYLRDRRDEVFHIDTRASALPIDYVEVRESHSFDPRIWRPLRALVAERRIDIVHAHDYKTDLLAMLLARAAPVVPLSTAHGWSGHSWREARVYYPADRWLLARFPRVVAVSSDIKARLVGAGAKPDRVTVIPNGIDERQFRRDEGRVAAARAALGADPGDVVIGAVGRLEAEKNYPLLIRAFASLLPECPRLRLVIGGEGTLRDALQQAIADAGITGRCRLLGQVHDVVALHHALDVFVLCSDNEGSPNAILEAMALGTPVIATDVGGIADLVTHGVEGLLVPRGDGERLSAAIADTSRDPDAARARAAAARRKVECEMTFARRMQKLESLYDEIMDAHAAIRAGRRWWKAHDA